MHLAQAATGDPALALHFGEAVSMSDLSIVGLIMEAAPTMGDAFLQMQRFGRLAIEMDDGHGRPRYQQVIRGEDLFIADSRHEPNAFPELTETSFAWLVCGPRRFLPKPHVLEVHVTHPAPAYRAEYERIFQCPVVFGASWNALRLPPDLASWPVAKSQTYMFGVLLERAETLHANLVASTTTRGAVEAALLPSLHLGPISAEAMAAKLGFSRQTLFRKLKAEGTTFADVLDSLRKQLAIQYLLGRKTSANETAYLVGFSDPAAFSRAFKRWTGEAPRAFAAARRSA